MPRPGCPGAVAARVLLQTNGHMETAGCARLDHRQGIHRIVAGYRTSRVSMGRLRMDGAAAEFRDYAQHDSSRPGRARGAAMPVPVSIATVAPLGELGRDMRRGRQEELQAATGLKRFGAKVVQLEKKGQARAVQRGGQSPLFALPSFAGRPVRRAGGRITLDKAPVCQLTGIIIPCDDSNWIRHRADDDLVPNVLRAAGSAAHLSNRVASATGAPLGGEPGNRIAKGIDDPEKSRGRTLPALGGPRHIEYGTYHALVPP